MWIGLTWPTMPQADVVPTPYLVRLIETIGMVLALAFAGLGTLGLIGTLVKTEKPEP